MLEGSLKKENLETVIDNEHYLEAQKLDKIKLGLKKNPELIIKKYSNDNTILHLAIKAKLQIIANYLIYKGKNININAQNKDGDTPLHLAIQMLPEVAEILIDRKCQFLDNNLKEGPLHIAAMKNSNEVVKIVKLLINLNYPLTFQNSKGESPLHLAAKYQSVLILLILSRQPEVIKYINSVDSKNETALHLAVRSGCTECIRILLQQPSLDIEIKNTNQQTAKDLIYSLELDNREKIIEAFKTMPIKNSLMQGYDGELFKNPTVNIGGENIIELQKTFKSLKIGSFFNISNEQKESSFSNDELIEITEEDFFFARMGKIESFLSQGGDPNAEISQGKMPLLFYAFVYKQNMIFIRLILAGANLWEQKLIEHIELMMFSDENGSHTKFIFDVRQQLFASANNKINDLMIKIQVASKKLETLLSEHRLISCFYDKDIATINSLKIINKDPNVANCMNALYDLCSGKIYEKNEDPSKSIIRYFDIQHIKTCLFGLLDQFDPECIVDALIALENIKSLKTIQKVIIIYILKEILILNLEFRYVLNEKFYEKLEIYLKGYPSQLVDALMRLNQATNDLIYNPIINCYLELGKLVYKYPCNSPNSIAKQLSEVVDPEKFDEKNFENFSQFIALEMRAFILESFKVCDLKEYRKTVWEKGKINRQTDSPNLAFFLDSQEALSTFVSLSIETQKNVEAKVNAFSFYIHTANNCLMLSEDELGPDLNSLTAILGGLLLQEKKYLSLVSKETREIYNDLKDIIDPVNNSRSARKLLNDSSYPLPFLSLTFHDKALCQEKTIFKDAESLSIVGKMYLIIHNINNKIGLLQKSFHTDLLFQLSKIKSNQSFISEIKLPLKKEPSRVTLELNPENTKELSLANKFDIIHLNESTSTKSSRNTSQNNSPKNFSPKNISSNVSEKKKRELDALHRLSTPVIPNFTRRRLSSTSEKQNPALLIRSRSSKGPKK